MIPRLIAAFVRLFLCADVMASILMGFVWTGGGGGRGLGGNPEVCWSTSAKNTSDCEETDLFSS